MATILSPNPVIDRLENEVILPNRHLNPTLGVIIKPNAPADDLSYFTSIQKKAEKYNVTLDVRQCDNPVEAQNAITLLKQNPAMCGIIILSHYSPSADMVIYNSIPTRLDIDCLSANTMGRLMTSTSNISYRQAPCAAVAAYKMLEYNGLDDLTGKTVAVLGRSLRVGRPLAEILCQKNATVTVFHTKSPDNRTLENFDIVISAIGQPKEITLDDDFYYSNRKLHTNIIIDVGINVDENGKVCGDVDFNSFPDNFKITPVPGGIGKLATVVLFTKVFKNAINKISGEEV